MHIQYIFFSYLATYCAARKQLEVATKHNEIPDSDDDVSSKGDDVSSKGGDVLSRGGDASSKRRGCRVKKPTQFLEYEVPITKMKTDPPKRKQADVVGNIGSSPKKIATAEQKEEDSIPNLDSSPDFYEATQQLVPVKKSVFTLPPLPPIPDDLLAEALANGDELLINSVGPNGGPCQSMQPPGSTNSVRSYAELMTVCHQSFTKQLDSIEPSVAEITQCKVFIQHFVIRSKLSSTIFCLFQRH